MALTRKQQTKSYRPLVGRAWRAYCYRECITDSTDASKEDWYRAELLKACGVNSSTLLDPRAGFERAMAWFEAIVGDSTYWQLRAINGDANRVLHLLKETARLLRFSDEYVGTIMRRMELKKPLRQCTADELLKLRIALLYHVGRQQDRVVQRTAQGEFLP